MTNIANFLSRYAVSILAAGSTSTRCEKTVNRIARAFNCDVNLTILPRSVMMTVWNKEHTDFSVISEKLPSSGLNFTTISLLSQLSWKIRDEHPSLEEAKQTMNEILNRKRMNPVLVTLLTGFANASFCRLFDGDWKAMLIVFIATVNGFWLKNALHKNWHMDMRLSILVAACSSSIIASSGFLFNITSTPDVALGTSVLYLVPGIPYINSVSELIDGHLLCCVSRLIQALVITACLGIGLSLGILIMNIQYF